MKCLLCQSNTYIKSYEALKVYLPHQHEREYQRTIARKRTKSPRHEHGTEFQGKVARLKRRNKTRGTMFIEWSVHDFIVLASYGHAHWYTSTAGQKKWHRGGATHIHHVKEVPNEEGLCPILEAKLLALELRRYGGNCLGGAWEVALPSRSRST